MMELSAMPSKEGVRLYGARLMEEHHVMRTVQCKVLIKSFDLDLFCISFLNICTT